MREPDYRQQLIDDGVKIEAALSKHGYAPKRDAINERSVDRIILALDAANDAGKHVQTLLDAERAKVRKLRAENQSMRRRLERGGGAPQSADKWENLIYGYLMQRASMETPTATRNDLICAFGCSSGVIDKVLRTLIAKNHVRRVKRGVYQASEGVA